MKYMKHGLRRSSEYQAWNNMKTRCLNKNTPSYEYYGARGIVVCDEWKESFYEFYQHIGAKPSPDYTLDRIDVDGNYEPGNVRWVSRKEQSINRRIFKSNKSGIKGIHYDEAKDKWVVQAYVNGKRVWVGRFLKLNQAKKELDRTLLEARNQT